MRLLLASLAFVSCTCLAEDAIRKNYLHQPIDKALEKFGLPSQVMDLSKSKLYVWSNSESVSMPVVTYQPTYGTFGNQPFQLNQMQTNYQQINLYCTLKLLVDEKGVVTQYEMEGNAGCDRYKE